MSNYSFDKFERHAVYTVHGEKCYICRTMLDMTTLEIDHVLPESLEKDKSKLAVVLEHLGRPADFDLNSYENWMPICRKCNGDKRDIIWEKSLAVQLMLQKAKTKAPEARKLAFKTVKKLEIVKALAVLERARADADLDEESKALLEPLGIFQVQEREPEVAAEPVRFTPTYFKPLHEILSDDGRIKVVKGPYGIGIGPSEPPSEQVRCPSCGAPFFNGARCITCGLMDDDF